jgi:hypothetical protein
MKFLYADESGEQDHSKYFVMAGVMVDAVKLRKRTEDLDKLWRDLRAEHPEEPKEIKTSRMINGKGGWNKVDPNIRKTFISNVVSLATENGGKIFCLPMDFEKLNAVDSSHYSLPFEKNKWTYSAMFLASLVQKKMQIVKGKKGLTVFVMDDNQAGMPSLTNGLYDCDPWFDGLYTIQKKKRGKTIYEARTEENRFDHIVNTAFAIISEHSTFVQVADVISYVYRRHFEIGQDGEAYDGEQALYVGWVEQLESGREKLGRTQECDALKFYKTIVPEGWAL